VKRALTLLAAGLLSACAPSQTARQAASSSAQNAALPFQADFTDAGVTWVANGQAYVARAPSLRPQLSPLPTPAVSAAWVGTVAWGALPGPGLIVTLDGAPETQNVGRAARLTHTRIYRQDGTAQNYGGGEAGGVLGFPDAAITGGDSAEYVRVGRDLYQPGAGASSPATLIASGAQPYLYALPRRGVATANVPTVQTDSGSLYRLSGSALERLDGTGRVLASVPHGPGLIGVVGGRVVTLSAAGQIRVFLVDLREVRP
jgi:hypothetical protein